MRSLCWVGAVEIEEVELGMEQERKCVHTNTHLRSSRKHLKHTYMWSIWYESMALVIS